MKLQNRPKIACCIPLGWHFVPRSFFLNCIGMLNRAHEDGYQLIFTTNNSCYMDQCRDKLVEQALACNPHYILWLDADQLYPLDLPKRLMRHISGNRLVVGGVTPRRSDGTPLIYKFVEGDNPCLPVNIPLNQGLIEVDAMGFGGIMTHTKVFEKIPAPRFKMVWSGKVDEYVGEDVRFYLLCREHNIKVWCDTNLHYGHLDIKPVLLNDKFSVKKEDGNG